MSNAYLPGDTRQRIQDLIKDRKITQAELAEKVGLSNSALSRYLQGNTKNLGDGFIIRIAKYFDVSTDFLLGETDISCGVGKLDIALADSEADYKIEIEKGLGHLTVNGNTCKEYHSNPSGASNHLDIEGGMGDINIDFGHSF